MKFISFNVNGYRACRSKGFDEFFKAEDADIFCIQETKMQEGQADVIIPGYYHYMNSAERKGYAGTLVYAKQKPLSVSYGIEEKYNDEGRVITLEYDNFYFVCAYVPNSGEELKRLSYRMQFEEDVKDYLSKLSKKKSVVYTRDLNVAHTEIDIKNPKSNVRSAGYTIEERTKMTQLLESGFTDTYRFLNPNKVEYSWWSYRFNARAKNIGWRIDYFLVSNDLKEKLVSSEIRTQVMGSDHAPVVLQIEI